MKELYEVTTKNYRKYYTLASGYDEAKDKISAILIERHSDGLLDADGSLKSSINVDTVDTVKHIGGYFIK